MLTASHIWCASSCILLQNLLQHCRNLEVLTQQMSVVRRDLMHLERNQQPMTSDSLHLMLHPSVLPVGKMEAVLWTLLRRCQSNWALLLKAATLRKYPYTEFDSLPFSHFWFFGFTKIDYLYPGLCLRFCFHEELELRPSDWYQTYYQHQKYVSETWNLYFYTQPNYQAWKQNIFSDI